MSFRADISIDWEVSPRIITVAAPSEAITMQDLYDTLRTLEAQQVATDDKPIVSGAGKENLGGGVSVGLTITLLNARLAFEARPGPDFVQCLVSGGNLVAIDDVGADMSPIEPTAYTQIILSNSSSATSINSEQLNEIHKLMGLDASNPLTISDDEQVVDDITLGIVDNGASHTVTRAP